MADSSARNSGSEKQQVRSNCNQGNRAQNAEYFPLEFQFPVAAIDAVSHLYPVLYPSREPACTRLMPTGKSQFLQNRHPR
jgi:hypothetical protein